MKEQHKVIIDQIGRTILGVVKGETDDTVTLNNPIILHFQPAENGQLQLQMFPIFFFELINKEEREQNDWVFNKTSIVDSNVEVNEDIISRYQQINTPQEEVAAPADNPKVISIDDL